MVFPGRVSARVEIMRVTEEDFENAAKYAKIFDEHRRVHKHGKTWNFEAYKAKPHNLREIKRDLNKQRDFLRELEKMKVRLPRLGRLAMSRNCLTPLPPPPLSPPG